MTTLAIHSDSPALMKPQPRSPIRIRTATANDFQFIDDLQKKHSRMVGFLRTGDIEKYIANGGVLIAEEISGTRIGLTNTHFKALKGDAADPVWTDEERAVVRCADDLCGKSEGGVVHHHPADHTANDSNDQPPVHAAQEREDHRAIEHEQSPGPRRQSASPGWHQRERQKPPHPPPFARIAPPCAGAAPSGWACSADRPGSNARFLSIARDLSCQRYRRGCSWCVCLQSSEPARLRPHRKHAVRAQRRRCANGATPLPAVLGISTPHPRRTAIKSGKVHGACTTTELTE